MSMRNGRMASRSLFVAVGATLARRVSGVTMAFMAVSLGWLNASFNFVRLDRAIINRTLITWCQALRLNRVTIIFGAANGADSTAFGGIYGQAKNSRRAH